jgi:cob(I)alamin adenosyltransferase
MKTQSTIVVFTGEGKGKTSAGIGLVCRALGAGNKVAFVQFIKKWQVSEDSFLDTIKPLYAGKLVTHKGGLGFYNAGDMSAKNITKYQHQAAARDTFARVLKLASSGEYDLVVCDEINNAVHDGLLLFKDLKTLFRTKNARTSLCLTGRNFPKSLEKYADIVSDITKVAHHFDKGVIAQKGLDY